MGTVRQLLQWSVGLQEQPPERRSWVEKTAGNHRGWQGDFQYEETMGQREGMAMPARHWAVQLAGVPTRYFLRKSISGEGLEL